MQVLLRYVSEATARGMLRRALDAAKLTPHSLATKDLPQLFEKLTFGIRLFIEDEQHAALRSDLWALLPDGSGGTNKHMTIHSEHDACKARILARTTAMDVGAKPLVALKVATAVSELTRNVLMYAGHGTVEITVDTGPSRRISITVKDHGPGIADQELVLSGRYKSNTGMGRGLLGVKRIADSFQLDTGPQGTTVAFEMSI